MLKVLSLFAGTQSDRKMFGGNGIPCDYKGVDIYSPERENIILDLSQDNIIERLKEKIGDWKPDFIWASPLCTPFSRATSIVNGTLSFRINNGELGIRTAEEFKEITHKAYVKHIENKKFIEKHQRLGELGIKLFENTKKIINYFNVPFAIENPASAVSKYILKEYVKNDTTYCMYGFDYKKRTSIYSNKKLDLKVCNHKGNHKQVMSGKPKQTGLGAAPSNNKDRSKVPPKLIKDVVRQLLPDVDKMLLEKEKNEKI